MDGSARRIKQVRSHRNTVVEREDAPAAAAAQGIVVHVHVHRDGAAVAAVVEQANRPPAPPPQGRRRRPTFSGTLFDWKGHYGPLVKRHLEALTEQKPTGAWQSLVRFLRPLGILVMVFAAIVFLRHS